MQQSAFGVTVNQDKLKNGGGPRARPNKHEKDN